MSLIKILAECKIVTPMLSSGANQQEFEIRAPEVKAGLRFWWRAFQPLDKKGLYAAEGNLFGSTDQASPFSLRILSPNFTLWVPGAPVSLTNDLNAWGPGSSYIFFSVFDPRKKDKEKKDGTLIKGHPDRIKPINYEDPGKSGRPVGKPFYKPEDTPDVNPNGTFKLQFRFNCLRDISQVGDLLRSLWLLENFGGLGGRTRKGAGSFEICSLKINDKEIEEVKKEEEFNTILGEIPPFQFKVGETPEQFLNVGLEIILKRWNTEAGSSYPKLPEFTRFDPKNPEMKIMVIYNQPALKSASEVMDRIGIRIKNFSNTYPFPEAKAMHVALAGKKSLPENFTLTKAAKGLPIIYNFSKDLGDVFSGRLDDSFTATTVKCDKSGKPIVENGKYKEGSGRRASPLLISCHQKGGVPFATVCHFPAQLVADNEKIWLKSSLKDRAFDKFIEPPGNGVMSDLIFKGQQKNLTGGGKEVRGPLIFTFNKGFSIFPLKDLTPKAPLPPKPSPNNEIPKVQTLLSQIETLNLQDTFGLDQLIEKLEKLEEAGDSDSAKQIALALKKKLEKNTGLWKKYKEEIESYL